MMKWLRFVKVWCEIREEELKIPGLYIVLDRNAKSIPSEVNTKILLKNKGK